MTDGPLTCWSSCSDCGKRVRVVIATSLPNPICRPCRRRRAAPYGPRKPRTPETFTCEACGSRFERIRPKTPPKTCSRACHLALLRRARSQPKKQPCAGACGATVISANPALCADCRETRKRERWQQKNRRRRAALREADSESYTLEEIAERDRFRCQLCCRKVDMRLKSPHPMSPTIDHIVPLAKGGDDTRANVQLAHRRCNTSKGVRGSQQLALLG